MSYATRFYGGFALDRPLTRDQHRLLQIFLDSAHVQFDPAKIDYHKPKIAEYVDLLYKLDVGLGKDLTYFVAGRNPDPDIVKLWLPPKDVPGMWCEWKIGSSRRTVVWNGEEYFYDYVDWLGFLIQRFFKRWGYTLSGFVEWEGEDMSDKGWIEVQDNMMVVNQWWTTRTYDFSRYAE